MAPGSRPRLNSAPNSDAISGTTTINACTRPWATDRPLTMSDEPRKTSVSTKPREDPISSVKYAAKAGIDKLAPHDLRRTCARLCHVAGGELEQIQFLLGHVSIQTTERYLGCKQKLRCAVNDRL